jgi:DNA-binding transcriptional MerR regulator
MSNSDRFSLTELADLAGVTPRTVRYYLAQGLLPAVGAAGPGTRYDDRYLARLRLIRRLQGEHLPLAEIRRRLDHLDDDEIRELAGAEQPDAPAGTALDYLRTVLGGQTTRQPVTLPLPPVSVPPPRMTREMLAPAESAAPVPAPALMTRAEPLQAAAPADSTTATPPPAAIERSQWDRLALTPDIELNIRRPLSRAHQKQVDRLVTIARELFEEDRP